MKRYQFRRPTPKKKLPRNCVHLAYYLLDTESDCMILGNFLVSTAERVSNHRLFLARRNDLNIRRNRLPSEVYRIVSKSESTSYTPHY